MKLALSGIAAAVMLAVLPAAQAADSTQNSGARQTRQHQRADQGSTQRTQPVQVARADGNWNRGRGSSGAPSSTGAAVGSSTITTTTTTTAAPTQHNWNHGGRHTEQARTHHGWQQGRHQGWDNRHHGWDNRHHGWDNRHYGGYDQRGHRYNGGHASINEREAMQRNRIVQAQRSGQLTRSESQALWTEQRAIEAAEQNYRSDGRFTREERADIQRRLDMSRQHIYQETHDADRRY